MSAASAVDHLREVKNHVLGFLESKMSLPFIGWYSLPACLQLYFGFILLGYLAFLNAVKVCLEPILKLVASARHPLVVRTPSVHFEGLDKLDYDFPANYIGLPAGGDVTLPRMHYLDLGPRDATEVVLCLHGELTWSFLYRKVIPVLTNAGFRVVVPDFIGAGKSDKYTSPDNYNMEMHVSSIRMLIEHLHLNHITLVGHEWGAVVGLIVVSQMNERFSNIVVCNASLPIGQLFNDDVGEPSQPKLPLLRQMLSVVPQLAWRLTADLAGPYLPVKFMLKRMENISDPVADAYQAPYPTSVYQAGLGKWATMFPLFKDDSIVPRMVEVRNYLKTWQKPALVFITKKDDILVDQAHLMLHLMKHAKTIRLDRACCLAPETNGEQFASVVVDFVNKDFE